MAVQYLMYIYIGIRPTELASDMKPIITLSAIIINLSHFFFWELTIWQITSSWILRRRVVLVTSNVRVFQPEDGDDMFLRNVGSYKNCTASSPRRQQPSLLPPWKHQILQCKTWGFRGNYEEWRLLGCYTMWLARTDVSEEFSASLIMVTRISELGTTLAVTSN
jgi:hypothetical protein